MLLEQMFTDEVFFGTKIPGVTTLLSNVLGKDEFADIPKSILDAATERGHCVHSYIEQFILTKKWPPIELAYQVYVDYFIEWYNEYKPEFISAEQKLLNKKDGYKGIIDAIFYYVDKETGKKILCMCDWKTSSNLNRFKTMCQLNLYKPMFEQYFPEYEIDELRTLSITKNGWRFSKFEIDEKVNESILLLNKLKKVYNG